MKDFKISMVWLWCLVTAFISQKIAAVSGVYTMSETCAQYAEGFIADPNSCESFGFCKNGQLKGINKCPQGYVYNSRRAICDLPSSETCIANNVTNLCQYAADGSFVAIPTDCNSYCYCQNKVALCTNCPDGQVFDSVYTRCVWSIQATTKCSADSICRLVPDGKFVGDPEKCGQYLACSNGVGTPGQCPKNTYFNKQIGMCQTNNPCENPTPKEIGLGVLKSLASNPEVCKTLKGTFPQYVTDEKTCMGYYMCSSIDGPGAWIKCPPGLHFNNGICVTPYSFPCAFDRCGNVNQTFVGAVGSQCRNYLICKNETSQGRASGYSNYAGMQCSKNQYFDEYSQTCDDNSPASTTYKLCP